MLSFFLDSLKAVVYFHVRVVKEDYKPETLAAELSGVTADAATPYERMEQQDAATASNDPPSEKREIV